MPKDNSDKTISSIGRAGLIRHISGVSAYRSERVAYGIGDDAAVLHANESKYGLISSETLVEGVEFDLSFMPFHQVGAKAVTAGVSDIYAMNGQPHAVLINLGVPNRITRDMIDELYRGIGMACSDYGCQLSGGDLTGSHNAMIISVTAYGDVEKEKIIYNSGAKVDDAVCVTGDLGSALAGLKVLLREKRHWEESEDPVMQPDLTEWDYIVKRQLVPIARKDMISLFRQNEIRPTSMIDVSQGLLHDLQRVLTSSQKGAYLYQSALPIDLQTRKLADEMQEDVDKYALYGGEDFELLFTLPEKEAGKLAELSRDFSVIGKITGKPAQVEMQTAEGEVIVFGDETG
ncbi:MAG: thiamine-phosphate kinase [Balneolaceae bacterium]|nr:MAG: thiamine-phosphate kinase [Balneolaceae bacterium]